MTARKVLQLEARERGDRYFEDPKGCKRGHTVFYTSSRGCLLCQDRNRDLFSQWADSRKLTGASRQIAAEAWAASRVAKPDLRDSIVSVLPATVTEAAQRLGVARAYASRLIRELESSGRVVKDGKRIVNGRPSANIWRNT